MTSPQLNRPTVINPDKITQGTPPDHSNDDNNPVVKDVGFGDHFKYRGSLDRGKFDDDNGSYEFKDGSKFVGKMVNGQFQGEGKHYFKNGLFRGVWDKGRVVSGDYVYQDDLVFVDEKEWGYCDGVSDRRYVHEHMTEIGLPGKLKLTAHEGDDLLLPEGCYDAGDGYLDPKKGQIFDYMTGDVLREPDMIEREFVETKSRAEAGVFLK